MNAREKKSKNRNMMWPPHMDTRPCCTPIAGYLLICIKSRRCFNCGRTPQLKHSAFERKKPFAHRMSDAHTGSEGLRMVAALPGTYQAELTLIVPLNA
ncbi:hypothetical protein PSEUDO8O_120478 [Pseudomonas sp. 8O]|nr:hypothetical protein PSEUDO8O_120478 [Pseudomonas sp. 8O]